MSHPLAGIRVVELGVVIAGPSAAVMLGDWGADIVKVEPLEGDPHRANTMSPYFQLSNHGKRSITLDLTTASGHAIMLDLLDRADVFITNLRTLALDRLGLSPDTLLDRNPRLVYGAITGYGMTGPGAGKAGYDIGAFWSRSGIAATLVGPGHEPPVQRPGMGDHTTGLALVAGVLAALLERKSSGRGQLVSTSLMRAGTFVISSDLAAQINGAQPEMGLRRALYNPLLACYQAADGEWFWLLGLQAMRHWPGILRAVSRLELLDDERFSSFPALIANSRQVIEILDAEFAKRTLGEWAPLFAQEDVWWDPVQGLVDVLDDEMFAACGALRPMAGDRMTIAPPVDLARTDLGEAAAAPELGQHTEEVLLELGYGWDQIVSFKDDGVVG
jgi:crotonobetainyl-CoA:carnitine CoA-transferase CaiB-like acyl-CoA transferase